jgi:hypothetical protein
MRASLKNPVSHGCETEFFIKPGGAGRMGRFGICVSHSAEEGELKGSTSPRDPENPGAGLAGRADEKPERSGCCPPLQGERSQR